MPAVPTARRGGLGRGRERSNALGPPCHGVPRAISPGHGAFGVAAAAPAGCAPGCPLRREQAAGPRCRALSLIRGIVRRSIIRC